MSKKEDRGRWKRRGKGAKGMHRNKRSSKRNA